MENDSIKKELIETMMVLVENLSELTDIIGDCVLQLQQSLWEIKDEDSSPAHQ